MNPTQSHQRATVIRPATGVGLGGSGSGSGSFRSAVKL